MKNEYVADLGDCGQYGLLRCLTQKCVRIGGNWYMTADVETDDGRFNDYLEDDWENCD